MINQSVCDDVHGERGYAIIGSLSQAKTCDIRDCDNRIGMPNSYMDNTPKIRPEAAHIFERLDGMGLKQRELASVLGINENKVSKVRSGERQFQGPELVAALRWLTEVEAKGGFRPEPDLPLVQKSTHGEGAISLRQVDLDLSMGDGANIDDYAEVGYIDFDAGLLRKLTRTKPDHLYVARGSGESMMPTLINGDMVIIDPTRQELNLQDRIWAISLFGAGGIKRLRPVGPGRVEVISDNPARENQVVDAEDLRILGRVIWIGREV